VLAAQDGPRSLFQLGGGLGAGEADDVRVEFLCLLREQLGAAAGSERYDPEALVVLADYVQRLPADRAGGAEDGDARWRGQPNPPNQTA
jgi:hypothetical protein